VLVFAKIVIIALVFEKNANFFAENWQKSQKIVIITSTPGLKFSITFFPVAREDCFPDNLGRESSQSVGLNSGPFRRVPQGALRYLCCAETENSEPSILMQKLTAFSAESVTTSF
jgi:hypothetical protein